MVRSGQGPVKLEPRVLADDGTVRGAPARDTALVRQLASALGATIMRADRPSVCAPSFTPYKTDCGMQDARTVLAFDAPRVRGSRAVVRVHEWVQLSQPTVMCGDVCYGWTEYHVRRTARGWRVERVGERFML